MDFVGHNFHIGTTTTTTQVGIIGHGCDWTYMYYALCYGYLRSGTQTKLRHTYRVMFLRWVAVDVYTVDRSPTNDDWPILAVDGAVPRGDSGCT